MRSHREGRLKIHQCLTRMLQPEHEHEGVKLCNPTREKTALQRVSLGMSESEEALAWRCDIVNYSQVAQACMSFDMFCSAPDLAFEGHHCMLDLVPFFHTPLHSVSRHSQERIWWPEPYKQPQRKMHEACCARSVARHKRMSQNFCPCSQVVAPEIAW